MMNKRNGIWQPWFLSAMVALGFGIVWAIVVAYGDVFVEEATRMNQVYRGIEVFGDGTPVVKTYCPNRLPPFTYETLDGKPIELPEQRDRLNSAWLPAPCRWRERWLSPGWEYRLRSYFDNNSSPWVNWCLMPDRKTKGSAYLEGYDSESKLCVGYIGRNGFQRERPSGDACFSIPSSESGPFHGAVLNVQGHRWGDYVFSPGNILIGSPWSPVILLVSDGQLLRVDLRDRSVHPVWKSSEVLGIGDIGLKTPPGKGPSEGASRVKLFLVLRTADEIVLLDARGDEADRFVIPEALRSKTFQFYLLSETAAMFQGSRQFFRKPFERFSFFWVDSQGKVERKPRSVDLPRYSLLASQPWFGAVAVPAPVLATPGVLLIAAKLYTGSGECSDYPSALAAVVSDTWAALVAVNLLGIVLAWVCYRRQRRYAQRWTWVWVGFVFLFGLPGLVGYLFHRRWAAVEPCPSCDTPAPRDRPACFECGQDFPRPAMKGTEVFA